jgi:apolipoprotein N-acyltransferase
MDEKSLDKSETLLPSESSRLGWLPEMRAVLSASLLWAAFPPNNLWFLGWVAMVPFLGIWVDMPTLSRRRMLRVSLVGGLTFWLLAINWVRLSDPSAWVGWLVMSLALAVWWPVMSLLVWQLHRKRQWPLVASWVVVWGFQEFGREYYLSGFPWYYLAHTQYRQVWLIQVADIGGTTVISLLMIAINAIIAEWFFGGQPGWRQASQSWKKAAVISATSLLLVIIYSQYRLNTASFTEGPRVALLQSDIPQSRRLNPDHNELIETYRRLTQKALDQHVKAFPNGNSVIDAIIWPETSFPYPILVGDPSLDELSYKKVMKEYIDSDEAVNEWYAHRNDSQEMMTAWADQARSAIIVGANAWDISPAGFRKYNTAMMFQPKSKPDHYYKMHLVPFGEYIPWTDFLPIIAELAPFPPDQRPNLKHGPEAHILTLGNKWRIAPLICFEDTVPHVVRRFFAFTGGNKPIVGKIDFFVNISNDGWFRGSEEHETHLAGSIFRCVETRTAMVRSVNTGISAIIDGNGQVVSEIPVGREDVLLGNVPIDSRSCLYRLWGDISGLSATLATILGCVVGNLFSKKKLLPSLTIH